MMFRSNFFCISLAVMVVASCKKDPLPTPLVANAGPDQIIMKPRNNTRLSGDFRVVALFLTNGQLLQVQILPTWTVIAILLWDYNLSRCLCLILKKAYIYLS